MKKLLLFLLLLGGTAWAQLDGYSVPATAQLQSCGSNGTCTYQISIGPGSLTKSDGSHSSYTGGTFNLTVNGTTYGYVDGNGNVAVAASVPGGDFPIFVAVTTPTDVTSITDLRTALPVSSSGGLPAGCSGSSGNITCASFTSNSAGVFAVTSLFGSISAPSGSNGACGFGPDGYWSCYAAGGTVLRDLIPFCNPTEDPGSQTAGNYIRLHATLPCVEATGSNFATGPPFEGNGGTSSAPDFTWSGCLTCGFWLDTSGSATKSIVIDASGGTSLMFNRLISSTSGAPAKQVSIGLGNGDAIKSAYSGASGGCQDKNGATVNCVNDVQTISGVLHLGDSGGAGLSLDHAITSLDGNTTVATGGFNGVRSEVSATTSATQSGAVSVAVTIVTAPAATTWYHVSFYLFQVGAGTSCTGNTSISPQILFTDPSASAQSTLSLGSFQVTTNGTANTPITPNFSSNLMTGTSYTFPAKASTTVQYKTTYTPGSGCSPSPTYTITPVLEQM